MLGTSEGEVSTETCILLKVQKVLPSPHPVS